MIEFAMKYTKLSIIIKNKPQYFIGSQLRGALGYALKSVTCINPSFICNNCFAKDNCLYYQFYEQKNSFHKYRFDFKLGNDFYDFHFFLFDNATQQLPYIISAFYKVLTQNGLGKERITFKTFELFINDQNCLIDKKIVFPNSYIKNFIEEIYEISKDITLKFVTPLRLKKNNRFLRDGNFDLKDLINSIYQRKMQLLGYGFKKLPYTIEGEIVKRHIYYKELTRQSNRQKTTMNLGGIMGEIEIRNLKYKCYNILKLGELIGVGKSTVFGLGKIEVEERK